MSKQFKTPYLHYTIPNFLKDLEYQKIVNVYDKLQFIQKETDLFHFFQTHELNADPNLEFFKKELNRQMSKLVDLKNTTYSIFASYYFKGDYLLCHDDVIEDRKFAFSYYLQDHPSGSLILYDNTAMKPVKTIKVTKNLLVIFEVSNISYHQVDLCKQDGRKAVTGWLNIKGLGKNRVEKKKSDFIPTIPKNIIKFPLEEDLSQEQYYCFPQMEYFFQAKKQFISGPCYERKINKLQLETTVVFELQGYELYSADFFKFETGNYLLLNDSVNSIKDDVLDVFLMQLPKKVKNSVEHAIKIVQQNGNVTGIPYYNNTAFMIRRNKKHYFVDLVQKEFFLGHLIYKKIVKNNNSKNKKSQSNNNSLANKNKQNKSEEQVSIKKIRESLIKHLNERQQSSPSKIDSKSKKIKKQQKKTKKQKKDNKNEQKNIKKQQKKIKSKGKAKNRRA